MYIGVGIVLLVLGAIAAFAVPDAIEGVDLQMIGYILMAGGGLAIILSLILASTRRTSTTTIDRSTAATPGGPAAPAQPVEGSEHTHIERTE